MSDSADYIKLVTERVVRYWDTPKAPEHRRDHRQSREPWQTRWFGQLLPAAFGIWKSQRRERAAQAEHAE
jgi:hypothetical protein